MCPSVKLILVCDDIDIRACVTFNWSRMCERFPLFNLACYSNGISSGCVYKMGECRNELPL